VASTELGRKDLTYMASSAGDTAKRYSNIKLAGGIIKGIVSFLLLLLFVWLGLSRSLYNLLLFITADEYFVFILFLFSAGFVSSVLFFPADYYLEFYLEHKYSLSNQTFVKWLWEDFKGFLVSALIGIPLMLLFFYTLNKYAGLWWLPFSVLLFIVSVLLARIAPVVILPLFYKVTPLENEVLKDRIVKLSSGAGMKVENVYTFNMSKNTKKANAAFTGLGATKRILLGDTLIENFTVDEIETVIAHELGHYKRKHIIKNIIIGTLSSFLTFFLIAKLYDFSLGWFGFAVRTEIAALPLLALWGMIIGIIQMPLSSFISRKFEYQADEYAVKSTGKKDDFISSLEKLTRQNLADEEPNPLVEWFFYSHPSINNRTRFIRTL
jgi:STE24 endopeptidase